MAKTPRKKGRTGSKKEHTSVQQGAGLLASVYLWLAGMFAALGSAVAQRLSNLFGTANAEFNFDPGQLQKKRRKKKKGLSGRTDSDDASTEPTMAEVCPTQPESVVQAASVVAKPAAKPVASQPVVSKPTASKLVESAQPSDNSSTAKSQDQRGSWYDQMEEEELDEKLEALPEVGVTPGSVNPQSAVKRSVERPTAGRAAKAGKEPKRRAEPRERRELRDPGVPSACLWVGNISAYAKSQELLELFSEHGEVQKLKHLKEKQCAFVTMKTQQVAEAALQALNQKDFIDKRLSIHFAKEQADVNTKPQRALKPQKAPQAHEDLSTRCLVLEAVGLDENEVKALLPDAGKLIGLVQKPKSPGTFFLDFQTVANAMQAKAALDTAVVEGVTVNTVYGKGKPCRNLWVGNVSDSVSEQMLQTAFSEYGKVESVDILGSSHCAFIHMASDDAARRAADGMHGRFMGTGHSDYVGHTGLPIKVNFADSSQRRGNSPGKDKSSPKSSESVSIPVKKRSQKRNGEDKGQPSHKKEATGNSCAQAEKQGMDGPLEIPLPKPKAVNQS